MESQEIIRSLQMGIWITISIMGGLILIYIYAMSKSSKNNNSISKKNNYYKKENYNDLNSENDDEGPIQKL